MGGRNSKLDPIFVKLGADSDSARVTRAKLRSWLDEEPYFKDPNAKIQKQAVISRFQLDTDGASKEIPRSEIEKFLSEFSSSEVDKLVGGRRASGSRGSIVGRKSSGSGSGSSSSTSSTSSTSTTSTSSTSSTSPSTSSSTASASSSSGSVSGSTSTTSSTSGSEGSTTQRKSSDKGSTSLLSTSSALSSSSSTSTSEISGERTPGKKIPIDRTQSAVDDINPRLTTPEDFRKRGGVSRSHTWTPGTTLTPVLAQRLRRRLSITNDPDRPYVLDGIPDSSSPRKELIRHKTSSIISQFASYSHVGYIPFNQDKVNQDRCISLSPFAGTQHRGLFAVFDGHGSCGHEVSSFLASDLPTALAKELAKLDQKRIELTAQKDPSDKSEAPVDAKDYIGKAFYKTFEHLKSRSGIDCTFSGSTAIVCFIQDDTLFACNVGDSRAVLAVKTEVKGAYNVVPLSSDQTPARDDERKRILKSGGRIESCQDEDGSWIGPLRVWLKNRPVPGLAMTRSFGDLIAAPIGVMPVPEIYERKIEKTDAFIIIASDGVWEFISNQEAVDIVASADGDPQKASELLYAEADARWRREEEVVDDITALVLFLHDEGRSSESKDKESFEKDSEQEKISQDFPPLHTSQSTPL